MSDQFSLKFRPKSFEGMVVGNPDILELAKAMSVKAQAILICGESGTGKTTLARILNSHLNGEAAENCLVEVNCGIDTGIESVRELQRKLEYKPSGKKTVVILDEVHKWTASAASALLKLLENPPHSKVMFALCTDQPYKLLKSVINRCRVIEIEKPTVEDLYLYLFRLVKKKKLIELTEENTKSTKILIKKIAEASSCIPRQAMQMLEDAVDLINTGKEIKDVRAIISNNEDKNIEKFVGSVIIAMYSIAEGKSKGIEGVEYLLRNLPTDVYGLIGRLQSAIYYGTQMTYGGKFNWMGKVFQEATSARKLRVDPKVSMRILMHLTATRERMKEPATDPVILVGEGLSTLMLTLDRS